VPHRRITRIFFRDMDRIELLRARIGLYRRYLSEGADGDLARTYLWLIRQDEIELAALVADFEKTSAPEDGNPEAIPPARSRTPKDDR
jgi:hypothetical protein